MIPIKDSRIQDYICEINVNSLKQYLKTVC